MTRRTPFGGLVLAVMALLVGCRGEPLPPDLEALPDPGGFREIEPAAREQLAEAWEAVEEARLRKDHDELLRTTGDLGELYHAYRMSAAAAVCYRNAERLEPGAFLWPYLLGMARTDEGHLEQAVAAFRRALDRAPEHGPTRLRLAEVELEVGNPEAVEPLVGDLVAEAELAPAAHELLGRAARELGRHEEAVDHLRRVVELEPEARVHHPLGLALRDLGRDEEAREEMADPGTVPVTFPDPVEKRLTELPRSAGSHLRRGNQALVAGDAETAAEQFALATEVEPANPEAWRSLAQARVRQGDGAGAIEALRRGLEAAPEHVWLRVDLATAYLSSERLEEAERLFTEVIGDAPDLVQARTGLARVLAARDDWVGVKENLEAVASLGADSRREVRRLWALALARTGDAARAETILRELHEEAPGDLPTLEVLADVLVRTDRIAEASELYRPPADAGPERRADLRRRQAELLWRHGRRSEAIEAFRAGVEEAPELASARVAYGNALQLSGRTDEAIAEFRRATELDPSERQAWLSEGLLLVIEKRWTEARDRLEEGLEHHPDDPEIAHTLARLLATAPLSSVRDGERAIALARRALTATGKLEHSETVAMALAEAGRFEDAISWQRGLAQKASTLGDRPTLTRLVRHLRLYEARRPVRVK